MFGKKKGNDVPAEEPQGPPCLETPDGERKKAEVWFKRARELGDKRQWDYAIEYYVNGLEFWPDAVDSGLKPLHGCSVARRNSGGGKPGFKDTMKRSMGDKDALKAFTNALWLFGHDPENADYSEGIVKTANRLNTADATMWAGQTHLKTLEGQSKTKGKQFQVLSEQMDEFADKLIAWDMHDRALVALDVGIKSYNAWRHRHPRDHQVENMLRNMSTKLAITRGKYQDAESFIESVEDLELAKDLHDQDRTVQADDRMDQLIAKAKAEFEAEPGDAARIQKYIELLTKRERNDEEKQALNVLITLYQDTGHYKWKQRADDIAIKQLNRIERKLKKAGDAEGFQKHREKRLKFELGVFKERVAKYPTDNRIKFDFAKRLLAAGRPDDAIPLFQVARNDPKNRSACGVALGQCFYMKKYFDQAIAVLTQALEGHEFTDDELAKDMLYWLGRSQAKNGDPASARKTYGKLLQIDYNYSDVRDRLDNLPSPQD